MDRADLAGDECPKPDDISGDRPADRPEQRGEGVLKGGSRGLFKISPPPVLDDDVRDGGYCHHGDHRGEHRRDHRQL